jgi:copper(I)-binding protein
MKKNNAIVSFIGFVIFTLFINSKVLAQPLTVQNGFVRATIPGTNISSAYMTIKNLGENSVTLVGVSSNISPQIEIHQHLMLDGMMKMRQKASITINGKDTVMLQPSGLHFMIFELSKPLIDGEEVTLTLHFSKYPDVVVALPVQSIKKKQHHH